MALQIKSEIRPMLEISNRSVNHGDNLVIYRLNFSLSSDEILMLVGPTGCGKTTILNAIAGLVAISNGFIRLDDWEANPRHDVPPEKRNVGMVFQDFALFPHLTVLENVCFRLKDRTLADKWLNLLGITELVRSKPKHLSGGEKQRVALARALAHKQRLILLDEPLSNLDAALKESLRWDIRNALKSAGIPAIWVTHDQAEALSVGDRLGILDKGKIVQLATPQDCYLRPSNRFTASFLGLASFIHGQLKDGIAWTSLGRVTTNCINIEDGDVDILVRPEDCIVDATAVDGNAEIISQHFEGGFWLYQARLDSDINLQIRTHHNVSLSIGQRVKLSLVAHHKFTAFQSN